MLFTDSKTSGEDIELLVIDGSSSKILVFLSNVHIIHLEAYAINDKGSG